MMGRMSEQDMPGADSAVESEPTQGSAQGSVLARLLVPDPAREFRGRRWLKIGLRTLHIVAFSALVGGVLLDGNTTRLGTWLQFSMLTGAAMVAVELHRSLLWLRELRGLAILVKVAMLGIAFHEPRWTSALLIAVIVLSSVVSHMPGRYRYWVPGKG